MSLIRGVYDPFADFNRFFDDAFLSRFSGGDANANREVDIHEDANNTATETFELPGLKKDDVSIQLHNNRLTVSGETNVSSEREENGFAVRERSFGQFERTLRLSEGVNEAGIKTNIQDGLLTVSYPSLPAGQAPKPMIVL
ncbi:HSP20-like chaperone [Coniophora puteana RWD-64-598 SS2]|uniref:HSP20-like chaperone n=1 Tax=Coniophora puteana (strain RWD-64-598) TaxID=741705 RepID=A0A5M3MCL6_CONPW|nr:HSP20-like chaperone [Coniophora puteana RWD-64-598 SS2]EIW76391.1 HSP20-like chaperone [Coniophora puteana RWD-64-598 SS2]